jgi:apolipoprotein N-acyltransferase
MATSQPLMEQSSTIRRTTPSARLQPAAPRSLPASTLLPAIATGALLWMCYHPLAWGWLAWVALVPLLCLVRSTSMPRRIYLAAWVGGLAFYLPALQWMRSADLMSFPKWPMHGAWLMLSVYCALYFPVAIYLTRVLERRTRLPLVITFPAVWVALEFARSFMLTGFAWYYLAHSQHDYLSMIQITDLGGVYTVSLVIAAVNALAFDVLYQFPEVRAFLKLQAPPAEQRTFGDDWPAWQNLFIAPWRRGMVLEMCGVAILIGAAYVYGTWRLEQRSAHPGPVVALLQGNLDQRLRNDADAPADPAQARAVRQRRVMDAMMEVTRHYNTLCKLAERCDPQPRLFIWPETSDPLGWVQASEELPVDRVPEEWRWHEERHRKRLVDAFAPLGIPQLMGIGTRFLDTNLKERLHNSALLVNGKGQPEGRYDKMHRVPWGEYVPLRDWLPFMSWLAPYDFDYSIQPGEHFTRFTVDDHRFGVLICYEDTDPFLARNYVQKDADGPPVDFLVNISNDGWFNGSSEHEEHLAISRFRAIECRRAMVRSVNMGISAVIDANGRVLNVKRADQDGGLPVWEVSYGDSPTAALPHAEWDNYKKAAGVMVARVPIDGRYSFYAVYGDWLAGLCWLLIGVGTVGVALYRCVRPAPAV